MTFVLQPEDNTYMYFHNNNFVAILTKEEMDNLIQVANDTGYKFVRKDNDNKYRFEFVNVFCEKR